MNSFKKYVRKRMYRMSWKYGTICPIHKKGDIIVCDSYRAVTLLCTTYKIVANIVYVKLVP